jgi:methanogenic corrinoid protein MtbC1
MSKELLKAIADMREEEALKLVKEMVEGGSKPMAILDAARQAMDIVGQRYQEGTYFLPELILAGEMLNQKEVEAYVKKLTDDVAQDGGYILANGAVIDDATPENLHAFIDTGKKRRVLLTRFCLESWPSRCG